MPLFLDRSLSDESSSSNTVDSPKVITSLAAISPNELASKYNSQGLQFVTIPEDFTPSALFFDMDGTSILQESMNILAKAFGCYQEIKHLTSRAMAGELGFEESLNQRLSLLEGMKTSVIEEALEKHITPIPGIEDFIGYFKRRGIPSYLITGGFTSIAKPIAERLGFKEFKANQLEVQNGTLTGKTTGDIVDKELKKKWVLQICQKYDHNQDQILGFGDGANDLDFLSICKISIGISAKPILQRICKGLVRKENGYRFLIQAFSLSQELNSRG